MKLHKSKITKRIIPDAVEVGFVGICAVAELNVNGVSMTFTSPGLWGIEEDCSEEHANEVFTEERETLCDMLTKLTQLEIVEDI